MKIQVYWLGAFAKKLSELNHDISAQGRMNNRGSRQKIWILALLGAIAVLLLYPFETTVVPEWKARIVDESGNPMRMTGVREVWKHYTIESNSHEEESITDIDGYVTFPRRTVRGSLLVRIGKPILNLFNVRASFGPRAYLVILHGPSVPDSFVAINDTYIAGQPLPTQIILKRMPH
jgi:hypothetical protein